MYAMIVGDIIGSSFENLNHRNPFFELFRADAYFTDETVITGAMAHWINQHGLKDFVSLEFEQHLRSYCLSYPDRQYGSIFIQWLQNGCSSGYSSAGNGALIRLPLVILKGFYQKLTRTQVFDLSMKFISITHQGQSLPDLIKIFIDICYTALEIKTEKNLSETEKWQSFKIFIQKYIINLDFDYHYYRANMSFDLSSQTAIQVILMLFNESETLVELIQKTVSIGGDTDTFLALTLSVYECLLDFPKDMYVESKKYFSDYDSEILLQLESFYDELNNETIKLAF